MTTDQSAPWSDACLDGRVSDCDGCGSPSHSQETKRLQAQVNALADLLDELDRYVAFPNDTDYAGSPLEMRIVQALVHAGRTGAGRSIVDPGESDQEGVNPDGDV